MFDRHLLGLRLIAKESGIETPEIFKEPSYEKTSHFSLSTSQVSSVLWIMRLLVVESVLGVNLA